MSHFVYTTKGYQSILSDTIMPGQYKILLITYIHILCHPKKLSTSGEL